MRFLVTLVGCVATAVAAGAQAPVSWLGLSAGSRLNPIAHYDGTRWTPTCEMAAGLPAAAGRVSIGPQSNLVTSGRAAIGPVRVVDAGSSEWQRLEPVVKRVFAERERRERVSAATLAAVPVVIESITTASAVGQPQIYYFHAVKIVPDNRPVDVVRQEQDTDPAGDLRLEISGWLSSQDGQITSRGTNATLGWQQVDDGVERSDAPSTVLTPLAVIDAGTGSKIWILQRHIGGSASFLLYDVSGAAARLLVRSDPGRCP